MPRGLREYSWQGEEYVQGLRGESPSEPLRLLPATIHVFLQVVQPPRCPFSFQPRTIHSSKGRTKSESFMTPFSLFQPTKAPLLSLFWECDWRGQGRKIICNQLPKGHSYLLILRPSICIVANFAEFFGRRRNMPTW